MKHGKYLLREHERVTPETNSNSILDDILNDFSFDDDKPVDTSQSGPQAYDELIVKIKNAYEEGRISKEMYEINMKKFGGKSSSDL